MGDVKYQIRLVSLATGLLFVTPNYWTIGRDKSWELWESWPLSVGLSIVFTKGWLSLTFSPYTSSRAGTGAAQNAEVTLVNMFKEGTAVTKELLYKQVNKAVQESEEFLLYISKYSDVSQGCLLLCKLLHPVWAGLSEAYITKQRGVS